MAYKCFISYAVEFLYGSGSKSNAKGYLSRAGPFYRPPGIPVLVGSDTFGRVHSGIPTQRPGPRGLSAASEAKDAIATSGASRTAKVQSYTGGQAPTSGRGEHSSQP